MSPSPADPATMASFFIGGLTNGFATPEEIVSWVDDVIISADTTEDWMLDLSTATDPKIILHHLYRVSGPVDNNLLARMHFDAYRAAFLADRDVRQSARDIFRLSEMVGLPEAKVGEAIQIDQKSHHGWDRPTWETELRRMIMSFFDTFDQVD